MHYLVRFETLDGNFQEVEIDANTMKEAITMFEESYVFQSIDKVEVID